MSCFVYVMECFKPRHLAKIGMANNVEERRKEVQKDAKRPVKVVAKFEFPDRDTARKVEAVILKRLDSVRLPQQEWQDVSPAEVLRTVTDTCFRAALFGYVEAAGYAEMNYELRGTPMTFPVADQHWKRQKADKIIESGRLARALDRAGVPVPKRRRTH